MDDLNWRAEEGFYNAWPAERSLIFCGYILRTSGGTSRRINSLNPLRFAEGDIADVLPEIDVLLRRLGRPLIVRVPSMAGGLDDTLTHLKFLPAEASTLTLYADLQTCPQAPTSGVELCSSPTAAWLVARAQIAGDDAGAQAAAERAVGLIAAPAMFACVVRNDEIASVALGVISRGLLLIESVATRKEARRQGCGAAVTRALMQWAKAGGVRGAALQVLAANESAVSLYRGLGFSRRLYDYHYRRLQGL